MAIIDRRSIEFDAEGLLAVVQASSRDAGKFGLPGVRAAAIVFKPDTDSVEIVFGAGAAARAIALRAEVLGALLVSFCLHERIPLPRYADKAVNVARSAVILTFRSEVGGPAERPQGSAPSRPTNQPAQALSWFS